MRDILKKVQINIPFHMLHEKHLSMILKERINPEIGFDCLALDHFKKEDFEKIADILAEAGLTVTMHAPFMDLRPGAIDPKIRQVSVDRLNQFFELIPCFRPVSVVCHASFDDRYYVGCREEWVENSIETWGQFLPLAEEMNTIITLENVYENNPHYLTVLLDSFKSPYIRFCFDTGHFNVFSEAGLKEWMDGLGPYLTQLHLHDNNGFADDHLPAGDGNFPFDELFKILDEQCIDPTITIEPHTEENLWRSLKNIKEMAIVQPQRR
ncbi:MAG: sugar phosphate isomerase/epimerase [Proteobacteria bacterium]|nr:sugar phosphate isomerase/epimerase [Pseudomonadota bacterium]